LDFTPEATYTFLENPKTLNKAFFYCYQEK
jgi:hypothetical protein